MIPAASYVTAQRVRRLICDEFEHVLKKADVLLLPTTPVPAPTIDECKEGFVQVDGKRVALQTANGSLGTACTIPFNVTGLPAITICCGFSSSGMPIGLQIAGRAFEEGLLFQVADAYERATSLHEKHPRLDF
jgi:aspartyl-tRNA(Asn)/glutamyl-tRNA(Gln) amidotransferase subunit A